jgi:hypothetical protein
MAGLAYVATDETEHRGIRWEKTQIGQTCYMIIQTLESRIREKIRKSRRMVFLRDDFAALGGYDQVGRVLRQLESQGRLVRIGKGLYAKARPNRITGKPMIAAPGGFDQAAKEALTRLGVKWEPVSAEQAYQAGGTQIPARVVVRVKGPFHRQIACGKHYLSIERYSS